MATDGNLRLLALCSITDVNWHVVAREAMRHGIDRLLEGEISEASRDGQLTRQRLQAGLPDIDDHLERVRDLVGRALDEVSARLVTVLDRNEYPSNLRVIPNPPPFLFYRGELRRDDAGLRPGRSAISSMRRRWTCAKAKSSRCWGATAPASPRC